MLHPNKYTSVDTFHAERPPRLHFGNPGMSMPEPLSNAGL